MQIFEQNNLADIWRIRNPTLKQYTFRKKCFWIHTAQLKQNKT